MAVPPEQQIYYQKEIEAFEAQDAARPPRNGAVLFIGSSILRFWSTLEQDMQPLPVLNRAFGGARTWEVLHYMDRIVLPYRPRVIVYYCGSNDVQCGSPPRDIVNRFIAFTLKVHAALPATRIIFLSVIKAPQKRERWDSIDIVNALIKQYCKQIPELLFIDLNTVFFDKTNRVRAELFVSDGVHLQPAAYREMTRIIKPVLENAWQDNGAAHAR
ncbi:MAG: GDSL-type esterase/lipase family protein [Desulfobacterota bacterium]|nr:GDSL-type esterase/lipase family protein [Thermodesulfobacteriota bacterium]